MFDDLNSAERPLRVLVGCETFGVVRRAFAALGHDVWSCDLLPADDGNEALRKFDRAGIERKTVVEMVRFMSTSSNQKSEAWPIAAE